MCMVSVILTLICFLAILLFCFVDSFRFILKTHCGFFSEYRASCRPRRCRPSRQTSLVCSDVPTTLRKRIELDKCDEIFNVDRFLNNKRPIACSTKKSRYLICRPNDCSAITTITKPRLTYIDAYDYGNSPYFCDEVLYRDMPDKIVRTKCRSSVPSRPRYLETVSSGSYPFRRNSEICSDRNWDSFFGRYRFDKNRLSRKSSCREVVKTISSSNISCPVGPDFKQIIIREKVKSCL